MIWVVFLSSLLLLVPFLSRSQQLLREFSPLAGISTVAASLHLLFLAAFSLGPLTSIMLSVLLSLGLYAGARQWVLRHRRPDRMLSMERLFERLYRMAREVEAHPERASASLLSLLRELFEPLDVVQLPRPLSVARASRGGSTLLVPIPDLVHPGSRAEETLVLRFAQRGHRLFNREDARLADRVVELVPHMSATNHEPETITLDAGEVIFERRRGDTASTASTAAELTKFGLEAQFRFSLALHCECLRRIES
jgi:hypothetical protein